MNKPRFANIVLFSSISTLLSACGIAPRPPAQPQWLADGSIALYREVKSPPPITITAESLRTFAPMNSALTASAAERAPVRISLDTASDALLIRGLAAVPLLVPVEGASEIPLDSFSPPTPLRVVLKQENPLWYAPDSYFTERGLAIPSPVAEGRFRRGALGPFALFLDSGIPIHTGPFWSREVGGLRISEEAGEALFALIPLGATLE